MTAGRQRLEAACGRRRQFSTPYCGKAGSVHAKLGLHIDCRSWLDMRRQLLQTEEMKLETTRADQCRRDLCGLRSGRWREGRLPKQGVVC